jgi:hypothetical protein
MFVEHLISCPFTSVEKAEKGTVEYGRLRPG